MSRRKSKAAPAGPRRPASRQCALEPPPDRLTREACPRIVEICGKQARPRLHSHHPLMGLTNVDSDLLPGTLELLVLKALVQQPRHGYAIVEHLRIASGDALTIGESALYPGLQRLLLNGWVKASWGQSENNRRARYYTLTPSGRRQLEKERATFEHRVRLIQRVLEA